MKLLRALTSSMLLSLEIANAEALLFTRLIATLRFFLEYFCFFFSRIARYAQSKGSRNLLKKIPQITCKVIFRSCLKELLCDWFRWCCYRSKEILLGIVLYSLNRNVDVFFLKYFCFFINRIARCTQSKGSRKLPKKIP